MSPALSQEAGLQPPALPGALLAASVGPGSAARLPQGQDPAPRTALGSPRLGLQLKLQGPLWKLGGGAGVCIFNYIRTVDADAVRH